LGGIGRDFATIECRHALFDFLRPGGFDFRKRRAQRVEQGLRKLGTLLRRQGTSLLFKPPQGNRHIAPPAPLVEFYACWWITAWIARRRLRSTAPGGPRACGSRLPSSHRHIASA